MPFLGYFSYFLTCIGIFNIILVNICSSLAQFSKIWWNTKKKKGHQFGFSHQDQEFMMCVQKKRSSKIKILKSLWIVRKSTLVINNNFPILPQKDRENPRKTEISIENYHLVSKFPVLTGNSWVGGSSFSEIPVSRHMFTYLHKCPPLCFYEVCNACIVMMRVHHRSFVT